MTPTDANLARDQRRAALMVAARAGDHAAYEALLRDCVPSIRAVARRKGVPDGMADDVVQETLLTIHRVRHTYDPARRFSAWLRAIAARRAIDVLRRYRRHGAREWVEEGALEAAVDPAPGALHGLMAEDRAAELRRAVAGLLARQREAVQLLALNGQSLAEAAISTGRSTSALKVNLHRALKALRKGRA